MLCIAYAGALSAWLDKIKGSFKSASASGTTITLTKNDDTEVTLTTQDTTYSNATTSAAGLMSADDKTKLNGVASGAEVNQNAFTTVKVGTTDLVADSKTDTLTITAGNNITLTPNASGDSFTIAATDTTYSNATTSTAGLMSAQDKTKLDGLSSSGGNYLSLSGGTVTGDVSVVGDLSVDSVGTLSANTLDVGSEASIGGNTFIEGSLDVDGSLSVNNGCGIVNMLDCTYPQIIYTPSAVIDELQGNIFDLSLDQNTNLTFAGNRPLTESFNLGYRILTLMIWTNGYSLTWNGVTWADGITPTLDDTKLNIITLIQFFANNVEDGVDPLYFGVYVGSFNVS